MPDRDGVPQPHAPTSADAALIVRQSLGVDVAKITRFPTGLYHYVYDVMTHAGQRVVVRLARPDTQRILAGGVFWHERLRAVGVPLAKLLCADPTPNDGFPYMLLERLPGRDLADVYDELTTPQKRALAHGVADLQARVATLLCASGFGFALSFDDSSLHSSWLDVLLADVERSRTRIERVGEVDATLAALVRERVLTHEDYLRAIEPTPFLDDTTTKNVLVHNGTLSGVVDTDYVCFGDPLFAVALTRMALLAHAQSTDYVGYWTERLSLNLDQARALDLYTAVFCLGFLSELGQRFNQDAPRAVDTGYRRHLERLLETLLGEN